jgi:hypothetical protein
MQINRVTPFFLSFLFFFKKKKKSLNFFFKNTHLQSRHLDADAHSVGGEEPAELVAHVSSLPGHELGGMEVFLPSRPLHRVSLLHMGQSLQKKKTNLA